MASRRSFAFLVAVWLAVLGSASSLAQPRRAPLEEWFPRLRKGMWVKVEGRVLAGGGLRATEIKVLSGDLDEWEITSTIVRIDAERRTLSTHFGVEVVATHRTDIQGPRRHRGTFAALQVGSRIETEGQLQRDGRLLADEIEVKRLPRPERGDDKEDDEITGRIEAIDPVAYRIVLMGIPVTFDAKTKNKTPVLD